MSEDLFAGGERAHARRTDPGTSHQAAEAITPGLNAIQQRVEAWARSRVAGFLDLDLVDGLPDLGPSTVRTRRAELCARNIILDSGRRERPEGASTPHTIWIHRDHAANPPAVRDEPERPVTPAEKAEARKLALQLDGVAKQNRTYGFIGCEKIAAEAAAMLRRMAG